MRLSLLAGDFGSATFPFRLVSDLDVCVFGPAPIDFSSRLGGSARPTKKDNELDCETRKQRDHGTAGKLESGTVRQRLSGITGK